SPRGFVDGSPDVSWQLDEADLAVVEMTSVAFDWLATGKPLVMVQPHDAKAEILEGGLLDRCPTLRADGRERIVDLIDDAISRRASGVSLWKVLFVGQAAGD